MSEQASPPLASADVAIIGGGPAGLAALQVLRGHDLRLLLIDEQPRVGGQITRQPPPGFKLHQWLPGRLYRGAKNLVRDIEGALDVDWHLATTVVGIETLATAGGAPLFRLWLHGPDGIKPIAAARVLLAPGCHELAVPFPGVNLPGVSGVGAIQTFIKSQFLLPGRRFVLAGAHPLQLIVADQILKAGGDIAAVVFAQRPAELARRAWPGWPVLVRDWPKFAAPLAILRKLKARRIPIRFGYVVAAAQGKDGLEQVTIKPVDNDNKLCTDVMGESFACDSLGLGYGFVASAELARQLGADIDWDQQRGFWLCRHDTQMQSSRRGLYVAGEITGVDGADAAIAKGRVAALALLADLKPDAPGTSQNLAAARRHLKHSLRFAAYLQRFAAPPWPALMQLPHADTLLCRCECITKAEVDTAMREDVLDGEINALKLATRAGMGHCQGRLCAPFLNLLTATNGFEASQAFTARMPAKPVPIRDLLSLSKQ